MTNLVTEENIQELYLQGRRDFEGADLERADLEGADLEDAYLRMANLDGANLRGVNLRMANLRCVDLEGANLQCANLSGANLRCAGLEGANLWRADLQSANLEGANLWRANLQSANLEGAKLNWRSHTLLAEILWRAADTEPRKMLAAFVGQRTEWCWEEWEKWKHPEQDWAIAELVKWVQDGDSAPTIILEAKLV